MIENCTLTGHADGVKSIMISPNGRILISASEDGKIKLWNLKTTECLLTLAGHPYGVKNLAISPDGECFASGGGDGTIKLWSLDGTFQWEKH